MQASRAVEMEILSRYVVETTIMGRSCMHKFEGDPGPLLKRARDIYENPIAHPERAGEQYEYRREYL